MFGHGVRYMTSVQNILLRKSEGIFRRPSLRWEEWIKMDLV